MTLASEFFRSPFIPDNYPVSVENERTNLATYASALKSTKLVISFRCASDEKVTYVFVAFAFEVSGACEKIVAVSGSFWSSLKFFRMMLVTARLLG